LYGLIVSSFIATVVVVFLGFPVLRSCQHGWAL